MSTTNSVPNYPNINLPVENSAITLTFFNGFFNQTFNFEANEFSIVSGIFKGLKLDDISVYTLTFGILAEAKLTGTNPADLAKRLFTPDGLKLDPVTVQLFNKSRKKTSFVGYRKTYDLNPVIEHQLVE